MEEKNEKLKVILTKDNSHTIYNSELNETYHSIHGAVQESQYVFIEKGLLYFKEANQINILEVGFGTGLNALLTLLAGPSINCKIHYTGIEKHLLPAEIIKELNYTTLLKLTEEEEKHFLEMHSASTEKTITANFYFELRNEEFIKSTFHKQFNLLYFDAFAPNKQADMWTDECFNYCYRVLAANGILVTYCAKGDVKRGLKKAGFMVDTLAGPPGKREMIRAVKK